uniref:Aminopeptidase n=1 Tax=Arion vulgaris TaxID=1028688 RepID=A0A0B7BBW7_9EUPU
MGANKFQKVSKRPLVIITLVFIVIVVIVGAVTWKITKDAYNAPQSLVSEITTTTDKPNSTVEKEPIYSQEEIRAKPWLSLRMLRDVLPVHYNITMYPDFYGDHGEFYGNETIEVQVNKPTRYFLVHVHNNFLNVTRAALSDNSTGRPIDIVKTFYYAPNEFFVIEAARQVENAAVISLSFSGSLTKAIMGIYKSTYYNTVTKEQRNIVSSKFEPTYARQAFPCFDEPNIKAEFTITLVHKPGYIALSNMPQEGNSSAYQWMPEMLASKFNRSVKMSTYLVCFIVCDFLSIETTSRNGITVRVFATPDKINQTNYALDIAKHSLDYYEALFNMTYPLPKQDLIAIPDFVSGAMEHWGLITFRESRLLYDPDQTSLSSLETVAIVVTHEMSHQWFGNIVTMDWWNDLWLNEGFASFMEYIAAADKETDWNMDNLILVKDLFPVMKEDSELSSHPIVVDVSNPSQITSVFDTITYSKGCSVIRMLESIMGKDRFFEGVSEYLRKFEWGNAKTDDLWAVLSKHSLSMDIKHIMDTWTLQDGFPYVNISLTTSAAGATTFIATQKRFMSNPTTVVNSSSSPFKYKWYISLDYKSANGVVGRQIMDLQDSISLTAIGLEQPNSWVKFNHEQQGFYRVLYPDSMWEAFSNHLLNNTPNNWNLSVPDRAGLLSDAFALAAADMVSYEIPLGMMSYLTNEAEYIPWSTALTGGIYYITNMLKKDPEYGLWRTFVIERLKPALNKLGYEDQGSHNERKLRADLMYAAGEVGEETTVYSIRERFYDWIDNNVSISVNLRSSVYKYGMFYDDLDTDWEKVWAKYKVEPSPQEKELLALSLASTRQPHLIAKLLDFALNEEGIKRQDFFTVVQNVANNIAAAGYVWDWARENYQYFVDRFTVADRNFGRMIYSMVQNYNTELKLKEVQDFFARYPDEGSSKRYRKMALESIERNIYWMKTYKPVIINWLRKRTQLRG